MYVLLSLKIENLNFIFVILKLLKFINYSELSIRAMRQGMLRKRVAFDKKNSSRNNISLVIEQ